MTITALCAIIMTSSFCSHIDRYVAEFLLTYIFSNSIAERKAKLPKTGDIVRISSLNKEATVLEVDPSKEEILVQLGKMKLKLKLMDVAT